MFLFRSFRTLLVHYFDLGENIIKENSNMAKIDTINAYARSEGDTGSVEVQVALLTDRIKHLTEHLNEHKQDNHSRRGLYKLVGQRAKLLKYLERKDINRFRALKEKLGLR